ncbi:MAG: hypothetical protein EXS36_08685 [Pedosphaera sp.]|nr:hypothetical protein [Pedosphaera sp.]
MNSPELPGGDNRGYRLGGRRSYDDTMASSTGKGKRLESAAPPALTAKARLAFSSRTLSA